MAAGGAPGGAAGTSDATGGPGPAPDGGVGEPRGYTGWKAGLVVVAITAVIFSVLNLWARSIRDSRPRPTPPVTVTTPTTVAP